MKHSAWGKTDQETGRSHALAHHSMDVAAVFSRMLELPVIRDRLETTAQAPLTPATCERLAALAFLHDIGKLHPGFQAKGWRSEQWRGPTSDHLTTGCAFLMLAKWPDHPFHGTMKEMSEWGVALGPLLETMIAHHGRPVDPPPDPTMRAWRVVSHYDWQVETATIDHLLHRWFGGAFGSTTPETGQLPDQARFHHAVAGLVALSDWIGSDRRYFEYAQSIDPDYHITAHRAAARALAETGFDPRSLSDWPHGGGEGVLERSPE